jgi:hypothetical protein
MIESTQRIKYLKTLQHPLRYSETIGRQIHRGLTLLSFLRRFNIPIEAQEDYFDEKDMSFISHATNYKRI